MFLHLEEKSFYIDLCFENFNMFTSIFLETKKEIYSKITS